MAENLKYTGYLKGWMPVKTHFNGICGCTTALSRPA